MRKKGRFGWLWKGDESDFDIEINFNDHFVCCWRFDLKLIIFYAAHFPKKPKANTNKYPSIKCLM